MKISHRLYLTVIPAVLGMLLMAALTYWGQYAHRAPEVVLVTGTLAVVTALVLTWNNAKYIARRIERLATATVAPGTSDPSRPTPPKDEIGEIERVVDRLSSAVEQAEATRTDREKLYERRTHDYARLLVSIADASARRLEEIRLPLHILLENHFGELNENQEEMLGAARTAAEAADADMLSLREIAALDLGERPLRQDRVKPSDLIDALRPMLLASAEGAGATLELEIAPLLPAVIGDRARLQDAFATLLRDAIASAPRETPLRLEAERSGHAIRFTLHGGGKAPVSVRWAAAVRVVQAHGGTVDRAPASLSIELPIAAEGVR
jgi:signal transduction histidine kinase